MTSFFHYNLKDSLISYEFCDFFAVNEQNTILHNYSCSLDHPHLVNTIKMAFHLRIMHNYIELIYCVVCAHCSL